MLYWYNLWQEQVVHDKSNRNPGRNPRPAPGYLECMDNRAGSENIFRAGLQDQPADGRRLRDVFQSDAAPGERGGEGLTILAIGPEKMFSFTWNSPPHLHEVRGQLTHVALYFQEAGEDEINLNLVHDGWRTSGGQRRQNADY